MNNTQHTPEDDMKLPENRTCSDCHNFSHCVKMYGVKEHYTTCDFSPSRFSLSYLNLYEKEKEIKVMLLEALVALDNSWTEDFPDGPDMKLREGCSIAEDHKLIWKQVQTAIAKATGAS